MTNCSDLFNDTILRYETLTSVRRTEKQKNKFLQIVMNELLSIREDVTVTEFKDKMQRKGKNIYIGDIKNANVILATSYDTPAKYLGNLYFKENDINVKNTMNRIILDAALYLGSGILIFIAFQIFSKELLNETMWFIVAIFTFIYFCIFKKYIINRCEKRTIIRNTSTIVQLLSMIRDNSKKSIAYSLLDYGCESELGLAALRTVNKDATIILLDAINTDNQIYVHDEMTWELLSNIEKIIKRKLYRVVSGRKDSNGRVYLTQQDLKFIHINQNNFDSIIRHFEL